MFLVPGLTPQEVKESEGKRDLSHSERLCGVAKVRWDMEEILGERRGYKGKLKKKVFESSGLVEEDMRKQMERAVRKRSGRVGCL